MTSFTRKLYAADPKAFEAFEQNQRFEHRHTYGKTPTLVQFDPGFSKRSAAIQGRTPRASFGQRRQVPSKSDCPHGQTFCLDNGLMASNCSACRHDLSARRHDFLND